MSSSDTWTIYCHVHIESGRRYVGLTKKTLLQRWNQHIYSASHRKLGKQSHFWASILKYGKDAFSHEVLGTAANLEQANLAEEYWIEHYDTRNPEKGFNLMKGGQHAPHPVKNPWDRPGFRDKHAASMQKVYQDPGWRSSVSSSMKKICSSSEWREAASRRGEEQAARPGASESKSARWLDPDFAVKCSDGLRRGTSLQAEKTHCPHGHEFTPENTVTGIKKRNGKAVEFRKCLECRRASSRGRTTVKSRRCACGTPIKRSSKQCRTCYFKAMIGKNTKIVWPPLDDLREMVGSRGYSGTARTLGVSYQAVQRKLSPKQQDIDV